MKLLVIGAGKMGTAAAYDMARSPRVESVTLADLNQARANAAAGHANKLAGARKVRAAELNASWPRETAGIMRGHSGVLSAVSHSFNLGLCRAAIDCGCHFVGLGGTNTVVRQEFALSRAAEKKGVAIAPDCGLSPGMASILAGELMHRVGGKADALKIYVGALPENPKPPFFYQLVFSIERLIDEYVEPVRVLRGGKICEIGALTEPEEFFTPGFEPLVAFHVSAGGFTLQEAFKEKVGECFQKALRYSSHFQMIRGLHDLGFFSSSKVRVGKTEVEPRALTSQLFLNKMSSAEPDVTILRVEAHNSGCITSFTLVDHYDPATKMSSVMRNTAWPASIVLQMICSGAISKRGGLYQEEDVPAPMFIEQMEQRGIRIESSV
jgi:lysine 6-dehydrogenase